MKIKIPLENPFLGWNEQTQCFGNYATDELGIECGPKAEGAARWCAMGRLCYMEVDRVLISGFSRWCMDNYNNQPVTVLNDGLHWTPRDFAWAWQKFEVDLAAQPERYAVK